MPQLTITLTSDEMRALAYVAVDPVEWVENFTKVRAAAAMQEIYEREVARMMADPKITTMPASVEEVFRAADIKTAAERHEEFLANPIIPPVEIKAPAPEETAAPPPVTPTTPQPTVGPSPTDVPRAEPDMTQDGSDPRLE